MRILTLLAALALLTTACRHDEYITFMTDQPTGKPSHPTAIVGMYVLCEGNMGSNKCTLDYLEFSGTDSLTHYWRNIYAERNPSTVKELGDVGNDLAIYGSKLWIVVNCSNKVEVCHATDARRIGQIQIPNARYLAFDGPYAYVSSYAGPVVVDENCPLGRVYKVDTLTLQKVDSLTVGYQPEEMAIANGKLYVANSGGYRVPRYDDRVSVIDLEHFQLIEHIPVGINLHRCLSDAHGQVWVSSRGDYLGTPSSLYWLDHGQVAGQLDIPISAMTLVGDSLYYLGMSFNYLQGGYQREWGIVDVRRHCRIQTSLFDAPEIAQMTMPYGLVVNPIDRDFYLMDAKNCVSSGELLHFLPDGTFDWRVWTGDIPSRTAWVVNRE